MVRQPVHNPWMGSVNEDWFSVLYTTKPRVGLSSLEKKMRMGPVGDITNGFGNPQDMNTRANPRRTEKEIVNEGVPPKARVWEDNQASLNGPNLDAQKKNCFYALQANKDKGANPDEGTGVMCDYEFP
uniref:Uncharacterized protein n=1 Tax=Solanum tuberosum TaxID=4113 RepID=M1DZE1_SOLTU